MRTMVQLLKSAVIIAGLGVLLYTPCKGTKRFNKTNNAQEEVPFLPLVNDGNNVYYYGAIMHGNQAEAIQFCRYHSMELVSIESWEENAFLFKSLEEFLGDNVYHFWTSGQRTNDNHWIWSTTGRPMGFTNWQPGQPDNNGGWENCVEAIYDKRTGGLFWNDARCDYYEYTICKAIVQI